MNYPLFLFVLEAFSMITAAPFPNPRNNNFLPTQTGTSAPGPSPSSGPNSISAQFAFQGPPQTMGIGSTQTTGMANGRPPAQLPTSQTSGSPLGPPVQTSGSVLGPPAQTSGSLSGPPPLNQQALGPPNFQSQQGSAAQTYGSPQTSMTQLTGRPQTTTAPLPGPSQTSPGPSQTSQTSGNQVSIGPNGELMPGGPQGPSLGSVVLPGAPDTRTGGGNARTGPPIAGEPPPPPPPHLMPQTGMASLQSTSTGKSTNVLQGRNVADNDSLSGSLTANRTPSQSEHTGRGKR